MAYLYKYRSMKNKDVDRIFTHNEVYFASPLEFNDPFDCKLNMSYGEGNEEFYKETAIKIYKKEHPDKNIGEIKSIITKNIKEQGYKTFKSFFKHVNPDFIYNTAFKLGIYSLSAIYDNILLYSHYTDGHKGFCLIFDQNNDFFKNVLPVTYSPNYPNISDFDFFRDGDECTKLFLTKAPLWKYEQEFRIIEHDKGAGIYTFPEEALTGVIFGCDMSEADKITLYKWTKKRKTRLKFFKAVKKAKEFGLDIVPLCI